MCRFMRLLYETLVPQGRYTLSRTARPRSPHAPQATVLDTYVGPPPASAPDTRIRVEGFSPREVETVRQIGRGGFGVVYESLFRGQRVAAKYPHKTQSPEQLAAETAKEVEVMKLFDHPNIVFLVGACTQDQIVIVTELCKRGSLFDCMHKARVLFSQRSLWRIMREIAVGLNVLHQARPTPVIHRDVKSMNILLDENWTVKVRCSSVVGFTRCA
mmetsp:Transcript_9138/g.19685  ORF Transcript_9138/g.19685 Transcript_9138/m.19685 type:complete len:215 (-) Transcript_9138:223-867(-)